jgi:predicted nucleic acid-binding protein
LPTTKTTVFCDKIIAKRRISMLKAEKIKKEIDILSSEMLDEVEKFISKLKTRKKTAREKSSLLSDLSTLSAEIDLPEDFSKQHDHYLYGLPKR